MQVLQVFHTLYAIHVKQPVHAAHAMHGTHVHAQLVLVHAHAQFVQAPIFLYFFHFSTLHTCGTSIAPNTLFAPNTSLHATLLKY